MKDRRTTTSYAVLGLLALRPWTTYELAKQVQRSLNWFWPRAERKLYDEPKVLVEHGLATASRESTGKRPRTVYTITRAGRKALRDWLDVPAAAPTSENEALVKVFYADVGSLPQLTANLDRIGQQAADRVEALRQMAATDPLPFPQRAHLSALMLPMHLGQEEATVRWAAWAKEQVDQWASTSDPGQWDAAGWLRELAATRSAP